MGKKASKRGKGAKGAKGASEPGGGNAAVAAGGPTKQDIEPLNPIFAWFDGGDVLQFGDLCGICIESVKNECKAWNLDTLSGLKDNDVRVFRDCPFYIRWNDEAYTLDKLSNDDIAEGQKHVGTCPDCGEKTLNSAVRTASEYGTRMNPRATLLEWCPCGHFKADKKEFSGDREYCVFCGQKIAGEETTVFRGSGFHLECFLRLRFFFTMSEMLGVAKQYMNSGQPLTEDESKIALCKTLQMVRAFKLTGNGNVIGINRVIHWLEGDQPVISSRTVLRARDALSEHLAATFAGEAERSVGVHILEDACVVYDNAAEVRWITRGAYKPVKSAKEFVDNYLDIAQAGNWDELDKKYRMAEIADGKCAVCGATSRSHRIASGEDDKIVYSCHHCWIGRAGKNDG
jgi:predicted RNA-binding Zn-ribbon protein involved in translation (DUF1610 family)